MADRGTLIKIIDELTGSQFKRAKRYLQNYGIPGGKLEAAKDADDMATLLLGHFKLDQCKSVVRDVLEKIPCAYVIDKFKDFFSSPAEQSLGSGLGDRAKLYDDIENALGKQEEDKIRNLLKDNQLYKKELEGLNGVSEMLKRLEEKGIFDTDLNLLKDLMRQIQRMPLVRKVEACEKIMENR